MAEWLGGRMADGDHPRPRCVDSRCRWRGASVGKNTAPFSTIAVGQAKHHRPDFAGGDAGGSHSGAGFGHRKVDHGGAYCGQFSALRQALHLREVYSKLMRVLVCMVIVAAALLAGDYATEIAKFRADREKSLVREDGWTTVVGLSWLREGDNRAGSDARADVPLPASLPAQVGVLTLHS